MTGAGPDIAHIGFTLFILYPVIACGTLVINEISGFYLHTRVNHIDGLEIPLVQIVVQSHGVGELFRVEGEYLIAVHVVDVHPDNVGRDAMLAKQVGNLFNTRVGMIAETTLLIAQGPQRRQLHRTGQVD